MTAPLRHLNVGILRRLGACIGAVLMLALLVGLVGAHHHATGHDAPAASASEMTVAASECPHELHGQHHEGECCLGLACGPALVPGASTLASPGATETVWPLTASAAPFGTSGGQFRPPQFLLTA